MRHALPDPTKASPVHGTHQPQLFATPARRSRPVHREARCERLTPSARQLGMQAIAEARTALAQAAKRAAERTGTRAA
ncbi:MAG: hypothetical protein ACP5VR_08110 [Acidimicrobiales bacterium]